MIMLANSNLLMMESATPVNLKEGWCYDNVDVTTDVNSNLLMTKSASPVTLKERWCYDIVDEAFVFSISEKCYYPFSLYLERKTCHKYPLSNVCAEYLLLTCDQVLEKYTEKKSILLGSYRVQAFSCLANVNSFHKYSQGYRAKA